jgi:hypothetical protein
MLDPQLDKALKEQRAQRSISEQVKWILKRLLAGRCVSTRMRHTA